jgi:DNA-binding GntR family transcriptional regulator
VELALLFEVREVLEGLLARRAASRISREEVKQFTEMFRSLDLSPTPEALARYLDVDRYFHRRLIEISGNQHLAHAMDSANLIILTYPYGLARPPKETIHEHLAVLSALKRQDPEASEAAMRLHLRRSVERMDKEADVNEAGSG